MTTGCNWTPDPELNQINNPSIIEYSITIFANMRYLFILILILGLNSCAEETATAPVTTVYTPLTVLTDNTWRGEVIARGYIHSLTKQLTVRSGYSKDSSYQDSNPANTLYNDQAGLIKIGRTFDSLNTGVKTYWTPQCGFIVYDLTRHFGGRVTNIRIANLKIKLNQRTEYTEALKFVVSVMDTTILTKTIKEKIEAVQSSTGEASSYLAEFTLDLKDKFSPSGKVVIGIKAENANQLFASIKYCKIEFDGDVVR